MADVFAGDDRRIALIGFGEAATTFLRGWPVEPAAVAVYDIRIAGPESGAMMAGRYAAHHVAGKDSPAAAVVGASLVFSLVTADQAVVAAEAAAPHLEGGALYVDGNSCSPGAKRRAAEAVTRAGGRYVDMAIMAPVAPQGVRTPVLLSGPEAEEAKARLAALGMVAAIAGAGVGEASTIKMLRSVMVKGFEALVGECLLAARRAGVEDAVLASLQASDPGFDWRARASYNLERMMVHGLRRAAEMREVAQTVEELGLTGRMAVATAEWQDRIGGLGLEGGENDLGARADRILDALEHGPEKREPVSGRDHATSR